MEGIVLLMVGLSPWAFAGVEPFEFVLYGGVGLLLLLWAVRILLDGRFTWQKCPVAVCLAALFLLGAFQLTPLPRSTLALLSPGTAHLYDQLLPQQREVLPLDEEDVEEPAYPPGSTLSLYPAASQRVLLQLLAVFLFYVVVRNNVASADHLRRLSWVLLANGVLLTVLAVSQFFTSPPNKVYWAFDTQGAVFGPFICRNHFAFYINICVGLGLGLLFARLAQTMPAERKHPGAGWDRPGTHGGTLLGLLHDPEALWVLVGLAVLLSGLLLCLSRGGVLALLGSGAVFLLLRQSRSFQLVRLETGLVALVLALGVVAWFGFNQVEARWSTLWQGEASLEKRGQLWLRTLPLVQDFPLWGTGLGTFPYVEPLQRTTAEDVNIIYQHTENEYLEALFEGGLVRLGLSVLAIGFVLQHGLRAVRRWQGQPTGALALGALFGFTAIVIHSLVDFGLHVPAIALVAAVLCANLSALGGEPSPPEAGAAPSTAYTFRLGGLAPLAGAVVVIGFCLLLGSEAWRSFRARSYRKQAEELQAQGGPSRTDAEIEALHEAADLAPASAAVQQQLGRLYYEKYEERKEQLEEQGQVLQVGQGLLQLGCGSALAVDPALTSVPVWVGETVLRTEVERELAKHEYLLPALKHYQLARDLCPLLPEPQLHIAGAVEDFNEADERSAYLERAKRVEPTDPNLWYQFGRVEMQHDLAAEARRTWRHMLELSEKRLTDVLEGSRDSATTAELLEELLPDRPRLLVTSAFFLYPQPEASAQRLPFLEKARRLFQEQPGPWTGDDLHAKAVACAALGQPAEALKAYQSALDREPNQLEWRYEYAKLLYEQGRSAEARQEILAVLDRNPGYGAAQTLYTTITRGK
jgi:tetratricopeptide (TPR) repeat protein